MNLVIKHLKPSGKWWMKKMIGGYKMPYSDEYIDKLINKYCLDDKERNYIYKNLKKCIRLSITDSDGLKDIGTSRVGGYPDTPSDFLWPRSSDGTLMTFIAQLSLKEISFFDKTNLLPKEGMLYFFMGVDEPAYNIEHKVIFIENTEGLKFQKTDEPTALDDVYDKFNSYKIIGNTSIEIPNYAYLDYDAIENDDDYFSMQEELKNDNQNYIGCMFGYPEGQHDDSELEAALEIIAKERYGYSDEDKNKLISYFHGDVEKAEEEIRNIQMLLEITSNSKVGFSWWDCGCIHFFIRKEDLINKKFDRTYLSLYSS